MNPKLNLQNTIVRVEKGMVSVIDVPKFPLKMMVSRGMTTFGLTVFNICLQNETINGKVYEEKILPISLKASTNRELIPNLKKATSQQDSAPGHCIRSVMKNLRLLFKTLG